MVTTTSRLKTVWNANHPDLQEDIYECEFNKDNIRLNGSYYDMFEEEVNIDVIQSLEKIYNQRENKLS